MSQIGSITLELLLFQVWMSLPRKPTWQAWCVQCFVAMQVVVFTRMRRLQLKCNCMRLIRVSYR